jgi:hypothetical protein
VLEILGALVPELILVILVTVDQVVIQEQMAPVEIPELLAIQELQVIQGLQVQHQRYQCWA